MAILQRKEPGYLGYLAAVNAKAYNVKSPTEGRR